MPFIRSADAVDEKIEAGIDKIRIACLALKAEGCHVEIEIVRLLGARPGQRNWEIATIGSNTPTPDVRRCIDDVQTRLGEQFQLRPRRR